MAAGNDVIASSKLRYARLFGPALIRFAPLLAAVIFGGWAAYVNSDYGTFVLVRSGLGQGAYALFSTWIVTRVAAEVLAYAGNSMWGMMLSFVSSFLAMISIPLTIHSLLGTPEIFNAILPGLIWGSVYISFSIGVLSKNTGQHS